MSDKAWTPAEYAALAYGETNAAVATPLVAMMWAGTPEEQRRAKAALAALGLKAGGDLEVELERAKTRGRLRKFSDGVRGAALALDRFGAGDFSGCVSTSLTKLDRRHRGGFSGGRLYLIGAPTGGGKTTFMQQIVARASDAGAVLLVSPEMSLESLLLREIVRESGFEEWARNPWGIDTDSVTREHAEREHALVQARILRENRPIYVLDQPDATMPEIERAAEAIEDLQLVVIDYAQQVAGDGIADERARYLQVGEVATRSVALSMRLGIPVVVASQVNEIREGKRRRWTFRESQILDHKAHAVMILDVEWDDDVPDDKDRRVKQAWIRCTKNRSGPCFSLRVEYDPQLYRLSDYTPVPSMGPSYRGLSPGMAAGD